MYFSSSFSVILKVLEAKVVADGENELREVAECEGLTRSLDTIYDTKNSSL
jgi:hypothetical protein